MKSIRSRTALTAAVLVVASAAICLALVSGQKLYINGQAVSKDVIVKGGVAYVPVNDIAKPLAMTASKRPDGYAMSKPGGANQVQGMAGKIGDDLFNGSYRFKVSGVSRGAKYTTRFTGQPTTIEAPAGSEFVAITCRLKSGIKDPILLRPPNNAFWITIRALASAVWVNL